MSENFLSKRRIAAVLLTVLSALAATAASWSWTGGGANGNWTTCGNWVSAGGLPPECYPSEDNDDVGFPINTDGWGDVILTADETMDDLTVYGGFDLSLSAGSKTLTVDSLNIGQVDAGTGEIVINIADGATLKSP